VAVQRPIWGIAAAVLSGWLSVRVGYAEVMSGESQHCPVVRGLVGEQEQCPNMEAHTRRTPLVLRHNRLAQTHSSECARSSNYSWVWRLPPFSEAGPAPEGKLSEAEISSFGCLLGGVSLFAAGYLAGPTEAIMLWGGGLLAPSGSAVLTVSILGGLGAAGCSFGATVAPTTAWVYEQFGSRSHALVPVSAPAL